MRQQCTYLIPVEEALPPKKNEGGIMKSKYFTLRKAQDATRIIPRHLPDDKLQKHLVKLLDYNRYLSHTYAYMDILADGGYFERVIDPSATGVFPKDIWLHHNINYSLDETLKEIQTRRGNEINR